MAKRALILGLDTAAGAYLARLLGARGYRVGGTGGSDLIDRLGTAADTVPQGDRVQAAALADEVYDLREPTGDCAGLLTATGAARIFIPVGADDGAQMTMVEAARTRGRFVATARIGAHESRLGPGTSPLGRIVAAASVGAAASPADVASVTDCGWTPDFVEAIARLLAASAGIDDVIVTGQTIAGTDAARIAAGWFRGERLPASKAKGTPNASGWRAAAVGGEVVEILCEGIAVA